MVYVNSKKFACESCIKGHRSSSCHHTDRPLFEIKKKGRPVSQCEKCRELRQSKKIHSKCTCNPRASVADRGQVLASSTSKTRRFIPIVPALPNGLRDVLAASQVQDPLPADTRQRVDSLLNPCNCKSVWKCNCRQNKSLSPLSASSSAFFKDIQTHVQVAAMRCCDGLVTPSLSSTSTTLLTGTAKIARPRTVPTPSSPSFSTTQHSFRPPSPQHSSHKRPEHRHGCETTPTLELPPIQSPASSPLMEQAPDFGFMPPISTITSLAGSGCTCGVECGCPGCVEHRGVEYAAKNLTDCKDGRCMTCIDNTMGLALPESSSCLSSSVPTSTATSLDYITKSSSLDRFLARAAALPPPPPNRRLGNGTHLDPRDVSHLWTASDKHPSGTVSEVNLPKLECCSGRCNCPNGRCGCGTSCPGCCVDSALPQSQSESS